MICCFCPSCFILIVLTHCIFLCSTSRFCFPSFLSPLHFITCVLFSSALDSSHLCSAARLYKWSLTPFVRSLFLHDFCLSGFMSVVSCFLSFSSWFSSALSVFLWSLPFWVLLILPFADTLGLVLFIIHNALFFCSATWSCLHLWFCLLITSTLLWPSLKH